MLNEKIESILKEIQDAKAKSEKEIEELRIHLLGKKGEITQLFDEFRTISADRKREFGQKLNQLKPGSVGQASRISGVSPADINVLLVYLEKKRRKNKDK